MANPTKLEAAYERLDGWWRNSQVARKIDPRQSLPFVLVFCFVYAASGVLLAKFVEWIGADWERDAQTALFAISWMMFMFVGFMTLMVRSAMRDAKKQASEKNR